VIAWAFYFWASNPLGFEKKPLYIPLWALKEGNIEALYHWFLLFFGLINLIIHKLNVIED